MFNMGMTEMIIIGAIALIVLGPSKFPGLVRSLGKGIAEFRRATNEFKGTIASEFEEATGPEIKDLSKMADSLKQKNMPNNLEDYLDTAANVMEGAGESLERGEEEIDKKKKQEDEV